MNCELEERLAFSKKANRLRCKGWPWAEIAAKLLGSRRYARGAKKLSTTGYKATVSRLLRIRRDSRRG